MQIGVIGSGQVGEVLANGLLQHGHQVMRGLLQELGWQAEDCGGVAAARAIEPLCMLWCMLWCIAGMLRGSWTHAFKLLRR